MRRPRAVASVLIGFDEAMLARSGLKRDTASPILLVRGGESEVLLD